MYASPSGRGARPLGSGSCHVWPPSLVSLRRIDIGIEPERHLGKRRPRRAVQTVVAGVVPRAIAQVHKDSGNVVLVRCRGGHEVSILIPHIGCSLVLEPFTLTLSAVREDQCCKLARTGGYVIGFQLQLVLRKFMNAERNLHHHLRVPTGYQPGLAY